MLYTYSKLIYKCFIKLETTQKKRLIINIICLRQLYKRREIAKVKQINRDSNPTGTITKSKLLLAFKRLINTNRIELKTVKQVKRTTDNSTNLKAQGKEGRKEKRKKKKKETRIQIFKLYNYKILALRIF